MIQIRIPRRAATLAMVLLSPAFAAADELDDIGYRALVDRLGALRDQGPLELRTTEVIGKERPVRTAGVVEDVEFLQDRDVIVVVREGFERPGELHRTLFLLRPPLVGIDPVGEDERTESKRSPGRESGLRLSAGGPSQGSASVAPSPRSRARRGREGAVARCWFISICAG